MKNRSKLFIVILGLSALVSFPVAAQNNQVEDSLSDTPSSAQESIPESLDPVMEEGTMPDTAVEAMPASGNLVEQAAGSEQFNTLVQAIQAAGLEEVLSAEGPFTVFAPTDEAFAALPEGTLEQLLQPENREALVQLLSYHVVPGAITSSQIESGDVETLAGKSLAVKRDENGVVTVNDATVTQADIQASNGVIHGIDKVILPPTQAQSEAAPKPIGHE
ncbi:fasciclin domain-containing protein [Lyngbya aestuarii]|uniref:fasciclin domain-containing protein n=1 Tax=Lyngbya aestuarii TaxID=118322 RepID=UPI00403D7DF2